MSIRRLITKKPFPDEHCLEIQNYVGQVNSPFFLENLFKLYLDKNRCLFVNYLFITVSFMSVKVSNKDPPPKKKIIHNRLIIYCLLRHSWKRVWCYSFWSRTNTLSIYGLAKLFPYSWVIVSWILFRGARKTINKLDMSVLILS